MKKIALIMAFVLILFFGFVLVNNSKVEATTQEINIKTQIIELQALINQLIVQLIAILQERGFSYQELIIEKEISFKPVITVLYPSAGEKLTRGTTAKIKWTYSPLPPSNFQVDLININNESIVTNLKKCGTSDVSQYTNNPNQFYWKWEVGSNSDGIEIPALGQYRIMVSDCGDIKGIGKIFNFVQPSISNVSISGGQELIAGRIYDITWNSIGINKVKMDLCGHSYLLGYICSELTGTNGIDASYRRYNWKIDTNHPYIPGSSFRIKVYSALDDEISTFGRLFDVISPTIDVISPKANDTLIFGQSYEIKWRMGLLSDDIVDIHLYAYDDNYKQLSGVHLIVPSIPYDQNSYKWTISPQKVEKSFGNIGLHRYYKITVQRGETPIERNYIKGESKYFRITESNLILN